MQQWVTEAPTEMKLRELCLAVPGTHIHSAEYMNLGEMELTIGQKSQNADV